MNKLNYVGLCKDDRSLMDPGNQKNIQKSATAVMKFTQLKQDDTGACAVFSELIPAYMKELDENAGRVHHPEWASKWAKSMIDMQGTLDRHLELCYADGNLVGFLYGKRDHTEHRGYVRPGWGYIMEFYILPEYRRKGYGRLMYARLENLFRMDGITQVYLTSDPIAGKPFWEAMGFINSGEISAENNLSVYEKDI